MKQLLFIVPNFETGGTLTSLINVLSLLDRDKYASYVYAITRFGSLKDEIRKRATIIGDNESGRNDNIKSIRYHLFRLAKNVFKIFRRFGLDLTNLILQREAAKIGKQGFDYVIAFQEGTATVMASFFNQSKKIAWVRSEYSRYLQLNHCAPELDLYNKFNTIVCVSDASRDVFVKCCPELEGNTVRVYDVLDAQRIKNLSQIIVSDMPEDRKFTIISIGRLDPVKRFSLIPPIAYNLKKRGIVFRWYILGGAQETNKSEGMLIQNKIREYGVEDVVVMLGRKTNPYSYLRRSNLLVSLSSSETFNYTLTEAKIMGVPVVTTDYSCAKESIRHKDEGIITSLDGLQGAIEEIIFNEELYDHMKKVLSEYQYDAKSAMFDIYNKVLV